MADSTAIKMKKGAESICTKCLHVQVCRYRPPFPCIECHQFFPAVVRCKECKHWECGKDYHPYCNHVDSGLFTASEDGEDFCSYGERKDGEG